MSSIELSTNVTPPSLPPFSELEIPRYIYPAQVFDLTKLSTIQLLNEWDDGVDTSRVDQPPSKFPVRSVSSSLHEACVVPLHHRLTPITSQDIPACKRPPSQIPAHDYPLQRQYYRDVQRRSPTFFLHYLPSHVHRHRRTRATVCHNSCSHKRLTISLTYQH